MLASCANFASDCFSQVFCNRDGGNIRTTESMSSLPTASEEEEKSRIEVYGKLEYRRSQDGTYEESYLNVQVTLLEEVIDEHHDLLYLVKQPDSANSTPTSKSISLRPRVPRNYNDLAPELIVHVTADEYRLNVGRGTIVLSENLQGRFKIYYLKPKNRERQIKSAANRLTRVGKGHEFNVWHLKSHSDKASNSQMGSLSE